MQISVSWCEQIESGCQFCYSTNTLQVKSISSPSPSNHNDMQFLSSSFAVVVDLTKGRKMPWWLKCREHKNGAHSFRVRILHKSNIINDGDHRKRQYPARNGCRNVEMRVPVRSSCMYFTKKLSFIVTFPFRLPPSPIALVRVSTIIVSGARRFQIGQITFHSTHIYLNSFRMGGGRCARLVWDEAFINYLFKFHFFSFWRSLWPRRVFLWVVRTIQG